MKTIDKIIKKTKQGLAGVGLLASFGLGGCALDNPTANRNFDALGQTIVHSFASSAASEAGYKFMNPNENNNAGYSGNNAQQQRYIEPELIVFNKWVDLNNNGKVDYENELIGLHKREFNLNEETLNVNLSSNDYEGNVVFRAFNFKNELIGITPIYIQKYSIFGNMTRPNGPISGDFMDNLKGAGPGFYTITATLDNGKVLSLPLSIK